jgi:hypothetical protein
MVFSNITDGLQKTPFPMMTPHAACMAVSPDGIKPPEYMAAEYSPSVHPSPKTDPDMLQWDAITTSSMRIDLRMREKGSILTLDPMLVPGSMTT